MASRSAINPSDPLYLHFSDNPGLSLVSQVFDGKSFGEWRCLMGIALTAKNKFCLVNGALDKPPSTSPTFASCERCNDMIISWMINSLSPDIRSSVIYTEIAKEIWQELEARYEQSFGV